MPRQAILVAALLAITLPAGAAQPDDALIDDGSRKLQSGDVDGALAAFMQAMKRAPGDPRPHYLSGAALAQKRDAAAAEKEYRAALAINPKLAEVHNELATLLMDRGRNNDAMAELKAAVAAKPDLAEGWYNLGKLALRNKQCPVALDAFARAAKLMPDDADTFVDLSSAQRKCNQAEPALASARQAVKLGARSADAHLNLAFCLDAAGKLDDAIGEAVIATRLKPESATTFWALGNIEHKRKRYDQALAALQKAQTLATGGNALKSTAPLVDDIGTVLRDKGDLPGATAKFREALQFKPPYRPAFWHLAETLGVQHKCAEMNQELAQLPAAESRSEQAQKLRAACK
jgi:Tfp pilus assembly protein PilF